MPHLQTTFRCLVSIAGVAFALFSHGATAFAFDHHVLAKSAVENHIRPGYAKLHGSMVKLERVTRRLCEAPSTDTLMATRKTFREAVRARAAMEHIRFGPIALSNRYERLAFWPDPKGIGRRQVRRALRKRKPGLDNPAALRTMSVAVQGLTALEIVLFDKAAAPALTESSDDGFRCRVAAAISANLVRIADRVAKAWNVREGYARGMLEPGHDRSAYLTSKEVTLELTQAFTSGLVFVRDRKIERPLGDENGARPSAIEYRVSAAARDALLGNLQGFENFYRQGGLRDALSKISAKRVTRGDSSFQSALDMLAKLDVPMEQAVEDEKNIDVLINLSLGLSGARSAVGKGINEAAGLSLGFNAGDGD